MNEQIQKLLNNLIQLEHVSSTLYLAMSNYMNRLNYKGMGSWLRLQSEEERTHMLKLIDYLVDRGGTVELSSLPAQPSEFGSPLETFQKYWSMRSSSRILIVKRFNLSAKRMTLKR